MNAPVAVESARPESTPKRTLQLIQHPPQPQAKGLILSVRERAVTRCGDAGMALMAERDKVRKNQAQPGCNDDRNDVVDISGKLHNAALLTVLALVPIALQRQDADPAPIGIVAAAC